MRRRLAHALVVVALVGALGACASSPWWPLRPAAIPVTPVGEGPVDHDGSLMSIALRSPSLNRLKHSEVMTIATPGKAATIGLTKIA